MLQICPQLSLIYFPDENISKTLKWRKYRDLCIASSSAPLRFRPPGPHSMRPCVRLSLPPGVAAPLPATELPGAQKFAGRVAGWNGLCTRPPGTKTKLLHIIRHAQGYHNVDADIMRDPSGLDARLTDEGEQQCASLRQTIARLEPSLIVTSPLTRTVQTAMLALEPQWSAGVPQTPAAHSSFTQLKAGERPYQDSVSGVYSTATIVSDAFWCPYSVRDSFFSRLQ